MSARLVLLTGKGGVGKSTVAAAMALDAGRAGARPLVVEIGRPTVARALGAEVTGPEPREIAHGVSAVALDIDRAVEDYLTGQLRFRALARALASTRALSSFLDAAPAVAEIATLHALDTWLDAGTWDPVIVDLDATGHARMLLELPRALDGLVSDGPLRALVGRATATLADASRASLVVVTLPEELPVEETEELVAWLRAEGGIRIAAIVVNQMPPEPLSAKAAAALDAIESAAREHGDPEAIADVALVRRESEAHVRARGLVDRVAAIGVPVVTLPRVDRVAMDVLRELGALLSPAVSGTE